MPPAQGVRRQPFFEYLVSRIYKVSYRNLKREVLGERAEQIEISIDRVLIAHEQLVHGRIPLQHLPIRRVQQALKRSRRNPGDDV